MDPKVKKKFLMSIKKVKDLQVYMIKLNNFIDKLSNQLELAKKLGVLKTTRAPPTKYI